MKSTYLIYLTSLEEKEDALNKQQQQALSTDNLLDYDFRGKRRGIKSSEGTIEYTFLLINTVGERAVEEEKKSRMQ